MTIVERILARVERFGDCWVWTGATNCGYGVISVKNIPRRVHRLMYEAMVGPIPEGLQLDHLCRRRACCNPAHLEAVTQRENLLRGDTIVAALARATHCKHGHPFDEANTYRRRDGRGRHCRACDAQRKREALKGKVA